MFSFYSYCASCRQYIILMCSKYGLLGYKVTSPIYSLLESFYASPVLVLFNLFFTMLVWSLYQSMTTDPGQVPVFWGFHLGDQESKRRRYCLMCNVFKPERCHHCSACNRCVLNMDHHCPWINNCVGFWNRKYFMLLLIYVVLTSYLAVVTLAYDFIQSTMWFHKTFFSESSPTFNYEAQK